MASKLTTFDAAEYLETEAHVRAYLEAALEENDPVFFQKALGTVARAQGMQAIAGKARTTRAGLYKALSATGNPEFGTILRVLDALGYRLTVAPTKPAARKRKRVA
jgi:probable addiction module antidote protein